MGIHVDSDPQPWLDVDPDSQKNEWGSTALIQIMQHFTFVCGIVTEMAAWIAISKSQLTMRGLPPGNIEMK